MKKLTALVLALILVFSFAACSSGSDEKTIKVGASPAPHAEILEVAKEVLAADGWTLEIVEFTDYVLPNETLTAGEIDANYFQHTPYLDTYNAEHGTDIASAAVIHYEPLGIYPGKTASLDAIADGATIAVPNDGSNEARALYLLQDLGLITVDNTNGFNITVLDIVDNPKNLEILEAEAAQLPNILAD
ncbi:MAG: metal ABC transporter substrate-binding protein, partial [Oscillospiraceae bacterium]|nr:metal ABC transporter substrate-binding protein [Oscillospiraceae bacterium]